MSHEAAAVRFTSDGLIMAAEVSNVVDVLLPNLWASPDELYENWRTQERRECACGGLEPAEVSAAGHVWTVGACRRCRAVDGPLGFDWLDESGTKGQTLAAWAVAFLEGAPSNSQAAEPWPESLRLAYCRSTNLPVDTPAETCQKLWRYGHLASIALRTDAEEAEVMALHQEVGALTGWPVVARRALDPADLEIFFAPRQRPAKGGS